MATILYVDDEPINLMLFEACFSDKYSVICAESGQEALSIMDQNPKINVVISDMKMPEMNGIEFIKYAKSKFPNLPYYILTGYNLNAELIEAIDNGLIIKCFFKPFNTEEIEEEINK